VAKVVSVTVHTPVWPWVQSTAAPPRALLPVVELQVLLLKPVQFWLT
jgi:hypothetical protein